MKMSRKSNDEFKKLIRDNSKLYGKSFTSRFRIFHNDGDPKGRPGSVHYHKTLTIGKRMFYVGKERAPSRKHILFEL